MKGTALGFFLWTVCGAVFIGIGIFSLFAKKPLGFWANAETFAVDDVKGYNRALGKLWTVYGAAFILLGLPLLAGQNSPLIVLVSVPGVMAATIAAMCVYTLVIEKKYRGKEKKTEG